MVGTQSGRTDAPHEDTPASIRRFVAVQHAGSFLRYLTGPRRALARVWKRYGIRPQGPGGEDHSAFVLLSVLLYEAAGLLERRVLRRFGAAD